MQRHQFPSQPPQLSSNTACQWVSDTKQLDPSPNTTGKRWHHHRENLVLEGVLSTKSKHKSWEASKGTIYAAGLKALSWWMTMLGSHLPINSSFRTGLNRIVYGLGTAVDFGLGKHCCCKCRQEKGVQNKNEKLWMCSPLLLQQIHVDIFRMNNRPMSPVVFFFEEGKWERWYFCELRASNRLWGKERSFYTPKLDILYFIWSVSPNDKVKLTSMVC